MSLRALSCCGIDTKCEGLKCEGCGQSDSPGRVGTVSVNRRDIRARRLVVSRRVGCESGLLRRGVGGFVAVDREVVAELDEEVSSEDHGYALE